MPIVTDVAYSLLIITFKVKQVRQTLRNLFINISSRFFSYSSNSGWLLEYNLSQKRVPRLYNGTTDQYLEINKLVQDSQYDFRYEISTADLYVRYICRKSLEYQSKSQAIAPSILEAFDESMICRFSSHLSSNSLAIRFCLEKNSWTLSAIQSAFHHNFFLCLSVIVPFSIDISMVFSLKNFHLIPSTDAKVLVGKMFSRFGIPPEHHTDQGTTFEWAVFSKIS